MRGGRSWVGLGLEFLVVLISILAAFGLESWWAGRQEAAEGEALRAAITADVRKNRIDVDSVLRQTAGTLAGANTLVSDLLGADSGSPTDSIRARFVGLGQFRPLLTTAGAYRAAVGAGRLELLGDSELVIALADYAEYRDFLDSSDRFAVELILNGTYSDAVQQAGGFFRTAFGLDGRDREALLTALDEPEVLSGIESVVFLQQTRLGILVELRRRLDEMLEMLGEEPMSFDPIPLVDPEPAATDNEAPDTDEEAG